MRKMSWVWMWLLAVALVVALFAPTVFASSDSSSTSGSQECFKLFPNSPWQQDTGEASDYWWL